MTGIICCHCLLRQNLSLKFFSGIRISTRPDYIDNEILNILKSFNVTAIELGAQSMDDTVLTANERGHSSQDVVEASKLIKSYGFNLGLQMMTGLYKSTVQKDIYTAKKFIEMSPSTVRIYSTVIMKDTPLATLYQTVNSFLTRWNKRLICAQNSF